LQPQPLQVQYKVRDAVAANKHDKELKSKARLPKTFGSMVQTTGEKSIGLTVKIG